MHLVARVATRAFHKVTVTRKRTPCAKSDLDGHFQPQFAHGVTAGSAQNCWTFAVALVAGLIDALFASLMPASTVHVAVDDATAELLMSP